MQDLANLKQTLKSLLVEEGMGAVMQELEKHLPPDAPKYNALIQLKARLNELNLKRIKRVLSEEQFTLQNDQLRDDIMVFIDSLEEKDFSAAAAKQAKMGSVLYRIPHKMEQLKETKCLVRLAFDESVIIQNIELTADVSLQAVRVSETMEVYLLDPSGGENFNIRSLNSAEQFLEDDDFTEWIFYVKPLLSGTHPLALRVSVIEIINGKERKKEIVLEEIITIVSKPVPEEEGDQAFRHAGYAFAFAGTAQQRGGGGLAKKLRKYGSVAGLMFAGIFGVTFLLFNNDLQFGYATFQDTSTAYNDFLEKHPNGKYALDAQERRDFRLATEANSPQLAMSYLASYTNGHFEKDALMMASNNWPGINLDSAITAYRQANNILPIDIQSPDKTPDVSQGGGSGPTDNTQDPDATPPVDNSGQPVKVNNITADPAAGGDSVVQTSVRQVVTNPDGTGTNPDGKGPEGAGGSGPATNPDNTTGTNPGNTATGPVKDPKIRWDDEELATSNPLAWLPNTMVKVKGGNYKMGCSRAREGECAASESPQRDVKVADFNISRFEVTQALWKAVMGKRSNTSRFSNCDLCPVEKVSWNDAQKFIAQLNLLTGGNYRLPTESEWEFAARQRGQDVRFGDGKNTANSDNINFDAAETSGRRYEEKGKYREKTLEVFEMKPNAIGLFHMSGNVAEWCEDRWHDDYLGAPTDGSAWVEGDDKRRVIRGGGWGSEPYATRTFVRDGKNAGSGDDEVGFRLVW